MIFISTAIRRVLDKLAQRRVDRMMLNMCKIVGHQWAPHTGSMALRRQCERKPCGALQINLSCTENGWTNWPLKNSDGF